MACWSEPSGFHVYVLSWISLVITLIAGIGGIVAYYELDSSLILVYGLENLVDFMSSAIVLWRFYLPPNAEAAEEARLLSREKRASVGISFVLAVLGFGTILTASEDFAAGKEDLENLDPLFYVSFFSIIIFGILALFKLHYAKKLNSSSLKKDGICSTLGAILAGSLFLNTSLTKASHGDLWWLDPFIAIICGIGSLVYGLNGVYKAYVRDGIPIFSCSWWMYGGDSRQNEVEMKYPTSASDSQPPSTFGPTAIRAGTDEEINIGDDAVDEIVLT